MTAKLIVAEPFENPTMWHSCDISPDLASALRIWVDAMNRRANREAARAP